MENNSNWT